MDEAVEKDLPATRLANTLKSLGLKAAEALDYLEEFNQCVAIRRLKARQHDSPPPELSADGPDHVQDQEERDRAVEAAWVSLHAKLEACAPQLASDPSSIVLDSLRVFEILGQEASLSTSLSKSVLAVAPQLADDEDTVFEDPYLNQTQKCKKKWPTHVKSLSRTSLLKYKVVEIILDLLVVYYQEFLP